MAFGVRTACTWATDNLKWLQFWKSQEYKVTWLSTVAHSILVQHNLQTVLLYSQFVLYIHKNCIKFHQHVLHSLPTHKLCSTIWKLQSYLQVHKIMHRLLNGRAICQMTNVAMQAAICAKSQIARNIYIQLQAVRRNIASD